jgi:hypothetical protein
MRSLAFSLCRMEFIGNNEALIAGRCEGDDMRIGDRVTAMVHRDRHGLIIESEPISFTITKLAPFYGRNLDHIPAACSGGLLLEVSSARGLRLGWRLEGQNE